MFLECTCADITEQKWNRLMKGARRISYKKLIRSVKKNLPTLFYELALDLANPWSDDCRETETHYILVHSAIEYFIRKESFDER